VTHDRVFLDNVVTSTLAFEGEGRVVEYVGGYEDYVRQSSGRSTTGPPPAGRPEGRRSRQTTATTATATMGIATSATSTNGNRANAAGAKESAMSVEADRQVRLISPATRRKKTNKEAREFEALPARIAALEEEQRALQAETESADFYQSGAEHIASVLARIDRIHAALEEALARWVELEDTRP
jgi:ABC transport system ATP-binding/permease protein